MMPKKLSNHLVLILSLLCIGLAGYAAFASVLAFKAMTKLQHAEQKIQILAVNAEKSIAQIPDSAVRGSGNSPQSDYQIQPTSEALSDDIYWATIPAFGKYGAYQYIFNNRSGKVEKIKSYSFSEDPVWLIGLRTSMDNGIFRAEYGGYAPHAIVDYFSTTTGEHLLSIWDEWGGLKIHIANKDRELILEPDATCDEPISAENPFVATGTLLGIKANGTSINFPSVQRRSCSFSEGEGGPGPLIRVFESLKEKQYYFDSDKNVLTIPTVWNQDIVVSLSQLSPQGVSIVPAR